jgi:hypothetical protein
MVPKFCLGRISSFNRTVAFQLFQRLSFFGIFLCGLRPLLFQIESPVLLSHVTLARTTLLILEFCCSRSGLSTWLCDCMYQSVVVSEPGSRSFVVLDEARQTQVCVWPRCARGMSRKYHRPRDGAEFSFLVQQLLGYWNVKAPLMKFRIGGKIMPRIREI